METERGMSGEKMTGAHTHTQSSKRMYTSHLFASPCRKKVVVDTWASDKN